MTLALNQTGLIHRRLLASMEMTRLPMGLVRTKGIAAVGPTSYVFLVWLIAILPNAKQFRKGRKKSFEGFIKAEGLQKAFLSL